MLSMLSAEQTKRGGGVVRWWGEVYKSQLRTRIPVVLYRLWSCSNWDVHVMMSHLATQLGYSAGEFQALQLIVLAAFGVAD